MQPLIIIKNQGQAIVETNYFDIAHAQAGALYLSWNASAARLLVPDSQKQILRELRGAREVLISRGPWADQGNRDALELLWEDDSDNPFVLHLAIEQSDRLLLDTDQGSGIWCSVWTRGGMKGRWPARYRRVTRLPCLQAWSEQ